jgi:hypothetical protein
MNASARRLMGLRCYKIESALHDLTRAIARHGEDHPAAHAAFGRLRYHRGDAPQRGSTSAEAIAWYREARAIPGYWNRSARRAARRLASRRVFSHGSRDTQVEASQAYACAS